MSKAAPTVVVLLAIASPARAGDDAPAEAPVEDPAPTAAEPIQEQVIDLEAPGVTPATPPSVVVVPPPAPEQQVKHRSVCLFGRPQPHCTTTFVIEIGYRRGTDVTWTYDLGLIANVTRRDAIGVTIGGLAMLDADASQAAVGGSVTKLRYRRWLAGDSGFAFDASIGGSGRGGVGEVALGFGDLFAVTAGAQRFAYDGERAASANVGVRVGALPILTALDVLAHVPAL